MNRLWVRIALVGFSIVMIVVGMVFFWLVAYAGDLPNLGLASFASSQPTQVVDARSGISVTSIPHDSIGDQLAAMRVAETNEASPTTLNESPWLDQYRPHESGRGFLGVCLVRAREP